MGKPPVAVIGTSAEKAQPISLLKAPNSASLTDAVSKIVETNMKTNKNVKLVVVKPVKEPSPPAKQWRYGSGWGEENKTITHLPWPGYKTNLHAKALNRMLARHSPTPL